MIRSIQYRFKMTTRALIHQSGSPTGIPENFVPLWIGMLPTVARPSREYLTALWEASQKITPPECGEQRAHYAMVLEIDLEDAVQIQRAPGNTYRLSLPNWYAEGIKAGAINKWDDTRIRTELMYAFGLREAP